MGINVNVSKPVDFKENEFLQSFVSKTHISPDDEAFWEQLLSFNIKTPNTSEEQLNLDTRLEGFLESFIQSNLTSGNLGSLITVFLKRVSTLLSLNDTERFVIDDSCFVLSH